MAYLLPHLLTETALRLPDKEAVRFQGWSITYRELDAVTNQVARAVQACGARRGDRIGVYVHKSLASVIAIFGIMKAGCVYVPLDPNAPAKRLAYMTRNCDVKILLTAADKLSGVAEMLAEGAALQDLILTDDKPMNGVDLSAELEVVGWERVLAESDAPAPATGAIETDLAYILYTSGSTGDPKGVMIAHRTIFTFINWCADRLRMTADDRVTSHAPLHFDLSTFDLYVTIKAGGTVVLVPEKLSIFPMQLVKFLQDERITVTYMVPSILSLMVNYGRLSSHDLSHLRLVLFAGEVFPIRYLRELVAALPHAEFYNLYGPTETNVCTYYKVRPVDLDPASARPVPIGVACENMEVFAVAEDGQRVTGPGQEGELWVRGSCVAQGYWGDPEKTARGFVANLFQPHYAEVAYRTGDIVTLDDDGVNWRLVGRRDHMIKSRGYRIELGEIESALYSHEGVKEAVVVAIPDDLVGNRLKAVVVPMEGNGLSVKELQSVCSRRLPHYMVPEIIEFWEELPKTSTGKINRTLLAQTKEMQTLEGEKS
jgi:amino acid adenylation domain-containing protein